MANFKYQYAAFILELIIAFGLINKGLQADPYFLIADSLAVSDSTVIADTLSRDTLDAVGQRSLNPIYTKGLIDDEDHGTIFTKEELQKNDYRYAGDLFNYIPGGFLFDLGSLGQPNEISIYGKGYQNVSYLVDGIDINNRITNSFNLYNLQSENIDSLEILPLPKGFLYGNTNNTVTAAIYSIDTVSDVPRSRIRFFQAPDEETYIDASFTAMFMKKFNFSFDATNSSVSSRFDNSNYGGWRASAKLRYLYSDNINAVAGYSYVKTETELNGGVDASSKNAVTYDNILEDAVYPTEAVAGGTFSSRYQKLTQHNVYLKFLGSLFENSTSELLLYRLFNKTEYRQNERTQIDRLPQIIHDNIYTSSGLSFRQDINFNPIAVKILSNYESTKFESPLYSSEDNLNKFTLAGSVSFRLLNGKLTPSAFAKYLNYDNGNYYGVGADINLSLFDNINIYAGYSKFERKQTIMYTDFNKNLKPPALQNIKSLEMGAKFNTDHINGSVSFFNSKNDNDVFYTADRSSDTLLTNEATGFFTEASSVTGINLNFNIRSWKLQLTTNSTYYFDHQKEKLTLPEFSLFSGLYYIDTLFNTNLKLKAGINFYLNGSQNYFIYDFEKSIRIQYANTGTSINLINDEISDVSYRMDLFVAGQFQDSAILYITFENVLGSNYYLVPYFPKQPRSLRFGISWEFLN